MDKRSKEEEGSRYRGQKEQRGKRQREKITTSVIAAVVCTVDSMDAPSLFRCERKRLLTPDTRCLHVQNCSQV